MSVKNTILLFAVLVLQYATGLDFCGAEDIPKCAPTDTDCFKNDLEPQVRKWLIKGQPGYFVEPMEVITFKQLQIPTTDGVYVLKDIEVKGFANARMTELVFDLVKAFSNYTYVFDFDVTANQLLNDKGFSVLQDEPLLIHMNKITVKTKTNFEIVGRCDGKQYLKFTKAEVDVKDVMNEDIVTKKGLEGPHDELLRAITKTVGYATSRKIAETYRSISKILPTSAYML